MFLPRTRVWFQAPTVGGSNFRGNLIPSSGLQRYCICAHSIIKSGGVVLMTHPLIPSTWRGRGEGNLCEFEVSLVYRVPGQSGLHRETLCQKKKKSVCMSVSPMESYFGVKKNKMMSLVAEFLTRTLKDLGLVTSMGSDGGLECRSRAR